MTESDHPDAGQSGPDEGADDQAWFDLMAGRPAPGARNSVRNEAAWLRAAMLSYRSDAPPGGPAEAQARIARLLARARREGVLPDSVGAPAMEQPETGALHVLRPAPRRRSTPWGSWGLGLALAASVAMFMVSPALFTPSASDEAAQLRGATLQTLDVADPLQRQQEVLQALLTAGFKVHPYVRLGRPGLDVDLPADLSATQSAALEAAGVRSPAGVSLQIEFRLAAGSTPASAP
ncbi:hypothetical protein RQP53_16315 [Paucibacter sp. APW11]|uniref:Anti sigma-E protein RseA N-terminal domain-containing protein n=1 Tax=Roseateles aquae TaxID=3077235 RepID=A0ABU3PFY3_9BURK|nr:hypothetical protein [Paucibacter sp. APW11]MDT9000841.1 hypothetical protein [Paucibacter sp. APW11]